MSNHQKRLSAPTSWPVERKTETFTVKADAGPHGEAGVPLLVLLRDVLGYVDSRKEARYALDQGTVQVNGQPVSDVGRPIGMFDIVVFEERGEQYRVFPDEGGRLALTAIDADAADSKLGKIVDKRQVSGGRTQLTTHDGQTLLVEDETAYAPNDSLVLDNEDGSIVVHFPYEQGALVTAVDGQHAGEIGTVTEIVETPGSSSNTVTVETDETTFETIEEYVVVIDENFVQDEPAEEVDEVESVEEGDEVQAPEDIEEAAEVEEPDAAEESDAEASEADEAEPADRAAAPSGLETLEDIAGVGPSKAETLQEDGYESVADVRAASADDLAALSGFGDALVEQIQADLEGGDDE